MTNQSNLKQKSTVILHGWGSRPQRWDRFVLLLKKLLPDYEVHVPYLPGFEENRPLKEPYDTKKYSEWLKSYLEEKHLDNPVIIGHSHGGRVALYYASHEKNISKLILIGAAGFPTASYSKKIIFKYLSMVGKLVLSKIPNKTICSLFQKLLYKLARESDYLKASPIMKKTMSNVLLYNASSDLKYITVPTLCVWGDKDKTTPLKNGLKIKDGIKNSKLEIVAGGHNIYKTNAEKITEIIKHFIKESVN